MARPKGRREQEQARHHTATPKKDVKPPSSGLYVTILAGLLLVGGASIILNYVDLVPGGTSGIWLIGGLAAIGGSFAMMLNLR
jgi:hypothetical protein